ncbi:peptidoglycan endopeptidase [Kribbella sandramycini]|uniref:Cell wall-associated NlpC family hydrolase n=1 Tax=Kribbella sandramycini TaxID=60450 RepID=A0A7Y4P4F7_9ACTN|nr:NlpC/P60 family protein [Kribbella sandramycini]MBB6566154.1 cell wall-associated NlpC family hydrolase [Kribbella sandramycini]NOL45154.1 peptidoglycan endopeptidase [Kribbella sandramycini]
MPVTARRTSLSRAVSHTNDSAIRGLAKHRKPSKSAVPRAAATVLSVGLAVSGGALVSLTSAPATAEAATTKAAAPTQARGYQPVKARPALRKGDKGPTVKFVQRALRLGPDGYYGNTTIVALRKFQASWGLKVTGSPDHATWGRLTWAAKHKVLYGNKGGIKAQIFREKVLKEAAKLKGTPYRYGGTSARGFDCSGYTGFVYKKAGKKMPRTSRQQYAATKHISRAAAKPGDLVFFKNGGGGVYHVGVYAGNNTLWHASKPGTRISKGKIWTKSVAFGRV